jgi:hypothetical protein
MKFKVYVDYTCEEVPHPFYVGKGSDQRVSDLKRNKFHKYISEKYGMVRYVVFETDIESFAFDKEIELIKELKTYMNGEEDHWGANFTTGGEGVSGYVYTEEQRKLMSESRKGSKHPLWGKKHSDESKRKNSESNKISCSGEKNGMFGKHHSEKTIEKIKENCSGWKHTEDSKRKISESIKERNKSFKRNHTEETKKKLSEARKGKDPWNKGKKFGKREKKRTFSEEARKNISDACKGRVPWNKGLRKNKEETVVDDNNLVIENNETVHQEISH